MKLVLACALVIFAAQVPEALSGVLMLTPNGLSYLNKDQYTQEKEMVIPQTGQGEWRNDPNSGGAPPPYQSDDRSDQEDDDEVDGDDEDKDTENEAEEKEEVEKDADDEEDLEEKDNEDEADKEKEDGADDDKVEDSEEEAEPKSDQEAHIQSLKQKSKISKLKAQDSEEAPSDDDARPPPPPPSELLDKMQYEQMYGQYEEPASPPLLSRMTSLLTSMFGGNRASQNQYGSDPFYSSRGAKSISAQRANSKVQKEPATAEEIQSRKRRDTSSVLSRPKRQLNLRALNLAPFYHVRNNIRTTVRRQPLAKLAPQPLNDFSELSEKASKPIKLIMEPYSAPQTLQSPAALSPKESVRGPGTGTGSAAAPQGGTGTGGAQAQSAPAQTSNKGSSQGNNGNKNNGVNRKKGNNQNNKNSESEEDSDENSSQQQDPFDYESDNEIESEEELNKSEADDEEDAQEEQDDEEEDY